MSSSALEASEKTKWTEQDFEYMWWHDNYIHGFASFVDSGEIAFDIDYILSWVTLPDDPNLFFWVAPATLVFANVRFTDLLITTGYGEISMQSIERSDPVPTRLAAFTDWLWKIDLHEGDIAFRSTGYTQYLRKTPILTKLQRLPEAQHGPVSFDRPDLDAEQQNTT